MFLMQQVRNVPQDERERSSARRWPWLVAAAAVAGAIVWLAGLQQPDLAGAPDTPPRWGFAAGALVALVAAVLAWFAGAALARAREALALHDARSETQALTQLLDVWHWQCDEACRLVRWQPPQAAPASAWAGRSAGQPLWDRFDADGAAQLRERVQARAPIHDLVVQQSNAQGSPTRWQIRGLPRLDANGRFTGYTGTARCIDEQCGDLAAPGVLRAMLDAVPGPMLVIDGGDPPRLRHANRAAARWLGSEAPLAAGRPLTELLAGQPAELREAVDAALVSGSASTAQWQLGCSAVASHRLNSPVDAWRVLALTGHPVASRRAAPADAEGQAFSYTVSHDLRAPLRVVEGFARILKEDYGPALDRMANDHLDRVLGAAARMNGMIDALLALAKLSSQPLSRQPVNLSQVAEFVVEDLRRGTPQRAIEVDIEPGLEVDGDPTLLRIAVENLLGNAWKYTVQAAQPRISLRREQRDGQRVFTVADNGAGFDMRYGDRLFRVFQRLHSASEFPGTGIGLASVRRIVERHGGRIWAESEPGHGARFHFTLDG
jgi:signal transduction histidine kinase